MLAFGKILDGNHRIGQETAEIYNLTYLHVLFNKNKTHILHYMQTFLCSSVTIRIQKSRTRSRLLVASILCPTTLFFVFKSCCSLCYVNHAVPDKPSARGKEGAAYRFVEYVSSEWEDEWRHNIVRGAYQEHPCKPLNSVQGALLSERFLSTMETLKNDSYWNNVRSRNSLFEPDTILSHLVYEKDTVKVKVVVEPLVGYYRHPYAICAPAGKARVDALDASYIIFRGMPLESFRIMYPGRKFLFDLGINGPNRSLEWLDRYYREYGIEFDQIWGWDSREFKPAEFWRFVPDSIYPKLHLMNVRVTDEVSDRNHPFQIIKRIFHPGDYIALKLDIDSPVHEQLLADQVLNDEELSGKVADFYYEKHFGAPNFPHHRLPSHGSPHDMKSVMNFFSDLRQKGIRAHYWV